MNETTMYNAIPVVSELNRVKGFDPTRFLRKTKDGPKLDLSIKKLWFRLKYPNGRIKLSALKITDQLAIIEARVYFDKNDSAPVSSFVSQRENKTTPGGLYIEMAQHSAIDEALSSAGFGIQFIPANADKNISQENSVKVEKAVEAPSVADKTETVATAEEMPTVAEALVAENTSVNLEQATITDAVSEATDEAPEEVISKVLSEEASADETVVTTTDAATPEVTEIREEETELPYTKDMAVDEICARMTVEEAGALIVPIGSCKGWTLAQVADRRPISLKWYISGYNGDDNILRAGATIMQRLVENKAA
jgi:hypothetical protein